LHDDFCDLVSQLALIDYINPSNSMPVKEEEFEDYNSSIWGMPDVEKDNSGSSEVF